MKLQWVPGVIAWAGKFAKNRAVDVGKLAAWAAVAAYKTGKAVKDLTVAAGKVAYRKTPAGKRSAVRDGINNQWSDMTETDKWVEIEPNEKGEGGGRFFVHPSAFFNNMVPERINNVKLSSLRVAEAVHAQDEIFYLDELEHEIAKILATHIGGMHISESITPEDYLALFLHVSRREIAMFVWHDADYPNEPVEQVLAEEHESGITVDSTEKEWREAHDLRVELLYNSFMIWGRYEGDSIPFWEMRNLSVQ